MYFQLAISIVVYKNNIQVLQKTIQSVLTARLVFKLYIIDNSPNRSLEAAIQPYLQEGRVEYIFNNKNLGFGKAHNMAMRLSLNNAAYHLVLNPDVYFEEGTLESLYNYMQQHENIGQIMPLIRYPNGDIQYVCKLLPSPVDLIFRRFVPSLLFKKRTQRFEMHKSGYNKIISVPYLSGCFMFFRSSALQKVGLFDETFFMYPEDIDITRRMHKVYATVFYPFVQVTHLHMRGSYKSLKLLWVHITNMIKYFNKWGWFYDAERKMVNKKTEAQYTQTTVSKQPY